MEYKDIIYTKEAAVATITFNRPDKRNSFSPEMIGSIEKAITDAASDDSVRVLVLTGAGRAFCSGGDVNAMADQSANSQGTRDAVALGAPSIPSRPSFSETHCCCCEWSMCRRWA